MLDVLLVPAMFENRKMHEYSFRSMQLAHQASLRERKNLLQSALRFQERAKALMEDRFPNNYEFNPTTLVHL